MSKEKLFGIISITASAFTIWLYILTQMQPDKNNVIQISAFFLSFITWLGSILSLLIFWSKLKRGNREIIYAHIKPSIRQGYLIASTLAILLFLQLVRVISWWDAMIVILVAILFEVGLRQSPTVRRKADA